MPNSETPLSQTHSFADQRAPVCSSLYHSAMTHLKLPFRYSKLAYGLSVCLMAQEAYAVEPTKPEGIGVGNEQYNPNLGKSQIQTDAETEEALIALKLRKAVEQGLIDPSVLEDYQRETLKSPVKRPSSQSRSQSSSQSSRSTQTASLDSSGRLENFDKNKDYNLNDRVQSGLQTQNSDSNSFATEAESSESIFNRVFGDSSLPSSNPGTGLANAPVMQSPQQLDQVLSETNELVSQEFDQPTARLESTEPPLGFDTSVNESDSIQTNKSSDYGITTDTESSSSEQVEGTQPVYNAKDVSVNPDSKEAELAEQNAKQSVQKTAIGEVDQAVKTTEGEITDEVVARAQQNGGADSGIDPDEYLPEYEGDSNQNQIPVNVEDRSQQNEDSETEPGFFKSLYNRLFNDGYASLPKIKATIYRQTAEGESQSVEKLVKADNEVQPFSNIEAALENITAESISDFTAVTPKLNQTALNAAQAVGYYDIELSFQKLDGDEVAVIVEYLGDPVKVNSRNIDIRGEGQEIEAFQTIQQEAPPFEGEVFNHGVYKQTKQRIETATDQHGFFDGQWLNKSVDVILPDNTADVDLVYDTGERYHFDEVVFFTIDQETGRLTTDPDKLPVKAELLHQLHSFEIGDDFYAPEVTEFTNDLAATRYFNTINVETIRPRVSRATLGFDNSADEEGLPPNREVESELDEIGLDQNQKDPLQANNLVSNEADNSVGEVNEGSVVDSQQQTAADTGLDSDFEPIQLSVDQETTEKLNQIATKAERLSRLPDDRVLDETEEGEAKNLLGKISNAISNAVEKIVPDEEETFSSTSELPDDLNKTVLANRKTPKQVAETKSVPLYVFVAADKPRDVDLGIGYGTDTGVRAVARVEHNLINRDGYQAGISVGASRINQSINVNASRPWKHPLDDTLNANISYEQETIDQGEGNLDLDTNTIRAGLARKINKDSGWNRTYSIRYRQDELESGVTGSDRENLPVPFNREGAKFEQEALLLGYQIDKTEADNVTNPTKGWSQYYSIEAGSEGVLTDTDLAIVRAGVNGIYSFGDMNKHQVIGSLNGGYIWADDFEDVPYKIRFFAGGDRSIRGYDYDSLSALENGYLVGGQVLAVGSTEYNYEFKPGFRGAVFADVGNAYDKDFEAETKLGLGFGIRWASPVGMVRVDLAAGVLEDSIPVRLHFFIGSPLQ